MNQSDVTIIDYGVGNMLSVRRGLERSEATVTITSDPEVLLKSRRVILPGVGAFSNAMDALQERGLIDAIQDIVNNNIPFLGICLGMQLLLDESEEFGITKGLGLIPGRVIPIPNLTQLGEMQKIPHIGWNALQPGNKTSWDSPIHKYTRPGEFVYFVHSFMAVPSSKDHLIADCDYGGHSIAATIGYKKVFGCQYHPEKSGRTGLNILRSFLYT